MSLKQRVRGVGIVGCETNLKEKYIVLRKKPILFLTLPYIIVYNEYRFKIREKEK